MLPDPIVTTPARSAFANWFVSDPAIRERAAEALSIACACLCADVLLFTLAGALLGVGKPRIGALGNVGECVSAAAHGEAGGFSSSWCWARACFT